MLSGLKNKKIYRVMITYKANGLNEPLGVYNNRVQAMRALDDFYTVYGDVGTLYLEEL